MFLVPSVVCLGHKIDAQGLDLVVEKVEAVKKAPTPRNVTELKSYLGLFLYILLSFLPNLSTQLVPLFLLLKCNKSWCWKAAKKEAFTKSKELLTSFCVIVHFNPELDITLACDT